MLDGVTLTYFGDERQIFDQRDLISFLNQRRARVTTAVRLINGYKFARKRKNIFRYRLARQNLYT